MNIRGTIIGTTVGLVVGGTTLTGAQAVDQQPDLTCDTVAACQVVLGDVYGDAKKLGAEVNDLRRIRDRQERRIVRLEGRVERLRERLAAR